MVTTWLSGKGVRQEDKHAAYMSSRNDNGQWRHLCKLIQIVTLITFCTLPLYLHNGLGSSCNNCTHKVNT